MTEQEKDLLLKDLCARLPYGVKATTTSNWWRGVYIVSGYNNDRIYLDCPVYDEGDDEWLIESIKPYLRPLSSMTEEEYQELLDLTGFDTTQITEGIVWFNQGLNIYVKDDVTVLIDWLIANHFDYRGLIPMGLALPALDGMYN